jgi:hypothetical protein
MSIPAALAPLATPDLVTKAEALAPSAAMASSAELCARDARRLMGEGKDDLARSWAQRSLGYSVNVFVAAALAAPVTVDALPAWLAANRLPAHLTPATLLRSPDSLTAAQRDWLRAYVGAGK